MAKVQDILVFYQTSPALDVSPVAWARYEASKGTGIKELIEENDRLKSANRKLEGYPEKHSLSTSDYRIKEDTVWSEGC